MEDVQGSNPKTFQIVASSVENGGCVVFTLAMPTFGEVLRELRAAQKLSQDALGAAAGVNGQTISNIETGGVVEPRGDTYRGIARALGMTLEQLDEACRGGVVTLDAPQYAMLMEVAAKRNATAAEAAAYLIDLFREREKWRKMLDAQVAADADDTTVTVRTETGLRVDQPAGKKARRPRRSK